MLVYILLLCYFVLYSFLTWKNFRFGLAIFIVALPSYLIRFSIWKLPTTLLEITFGALFFIWLIKYSRKDWIQIKNYILKNKGLFIFLFLFFVGSIAGIFVSDMWWASLGQWRAYFLEPILLFFVLLGRKQELKDKDLVWFLLLSTISISLVAIVQKLTGQLYPPSLWDDQLFGRATSFFTTPNAIGLYLAPIVMLAVSTLVIPAKAGIQWRLDSRFRGNDSGARVVILLALFAILFSFSEGAWVALGVGVIYFVYLVGYKKSAVAVAIIGLVFALAVPALRTAVLFQDQAGQNRLTLWKHSITYLTESPKNFIFGAGIRQYFRKIEKPTYNPKELERLIYPHNFLFNFWTEIGLLGVIGFVGLMVYGFIGACKQIKENKILAISLVATLVVILIHGLVDVPYFKNDLAFLFWIIFSLTVLKIDNNLVFPERVMKPKLHP